MFRGLYTAVKGMDQPAMREAGCIVPLPSRKHALDQSKRVFLESGKYPPGICHFCGCTDDNACVDPMGEPCSWFDDQATVCNAGVCIYRYKKERGV